MVAALPPLVALSTSSNSSCGGSGLPVIGLISDCGPPFSNAAAGDYRTASGRGVSWKLGDQHFGP